MNIYKRLVFEVDQRRKESKEFEEAMRDRMAAGVLYNDDLTNIQADDDSEIDEWNMADEDERKMESLVVMNLNVDAKLMESV